MCVNEVWGQNCFLYAKDGCLDWIYENANNYFIFPRVRTLKLYSQLEIATMDLVMLTCTFVLIISSCKNIVQFYDVITKTW
jgi:hypothetical protein